MLSLADWFANVYLCNQLWVACSLPLRHLHNPASLNMGFQSNIYAHQLNVYAARCLLKRRQSAIAETRSTNHTRVLYDYYFIVIVIYTIEWYLFSRAVSKLLLIFLDSTFYAFADAQQSAQFGRYAWVLYSTTFTNLSCDVDDRTRSAARKSLKHSFTQCARALGCLMFGSFLLVASSNVCAWWWFCTRR